jgi:anaerobic selenocysteine-containing dehydrogenase
MCPRAGWVMDVMEESAIKTTCPRDCYDACGITALTRDGRVTKVLGDRDHHVSRGTLCRKCALAYNGVFIDPTRRLATPLRRSGAKGSGSFEPVAWDDALGNIAARLKSIVATQDPRTIIQTHYTGTVAMLAGWFPNRFFNRLGATEVDPDTVCNKAGHLVLADMFGTSLSGFDPEQLLNTSSLLIWGANPSHCAPHTHADWVGACKGTIIVIDPIGHGTARRADIHLQLRPGSDAALAFGLLHVLGRAGLIDRNFVDLHVLGFDLLAADIETATPAVTEQRTGVPAALIERTALAFGSGPSLLWLGQGMQRQPRGGNAFRAAVLPSIATGYLGQKGAGFCYMNGPETRGVSTDFLSSPELRNDGGSTISHIDLADYLLAEDRSSALFTWNNNILASSPGQSKLRRALKRESLFTVVVDLFMTDTAVFADYVLPAASFLEFDDLVFPYFNNTVSVQSKAAEPLGQALPNMEIFRRLASAMGYQEPALYETDESLIGKLLDQTAYAGRLEELKALGTAKLGRKPAIQFEELRFNTPSGRIEVASNRLAAAGHPLVPVPHADPAPAIGYLRVLSPASEWLMNSTYGNDTKILARMGEPKVLLSAAELDRRGLRTGDAVVLRNGTGSLRLLAEASPDVPVGVALVHKGRWPSGSGEPANVNVLNRGLKTDIGDSTAVHGVEAEIERA